MSLDASQISWKSHFVHTGDKGAEDYSRVLETCTTHLKTMFEAADKPYSGLEPERLLKKISQIDLGSGGTALEKVVADTIELVGKNSILVQHPNCIAHLHTPPLLSSIAAESIIAALNQSMDSWDQASAATFVEQKVVDWLCELYQLGAQSDGVFTSGGTQSNQMGLLLARDWIAEKISHHSIQKMGLPDYWHKLRIICSENTHFTVQKSASMMGLGEQAVITVKTNIAGDMSIAALKEAIDKTKQEGLIPFAVVATAGTTDHGAIDDIDAIASVAESESLWLHVDGAYGGALILSGHKKRLNGIEKADSVSVDFHKLFYQTISCGAILLKDRRHFKYLLHHADYLNREHDELPNLVDKTIATTKRFDALKVFISMQSVGAGTLGKMVDHLLQQTQQVAEKVAQTANLQLLAQPSLSTVLFRLNHQNVKNHDVLNQKVRIEALTRGVAVLGETTIEGQSALKFTILNPCLSMSDFDNLLNQINQLAQELIDTKTLV